MDRRVVLAGGACALLAACATGPAPPPPTGPTDTHAPDFARALSESDAYEVAAGQAALRRSSDAQVREFAQMMIDGHTKSSGDLNAAVTASGMRVRLRNRPTAEARGKIAALNRAGSGFDKAYLAQQVDAHQAAVSLVRGYVDSGDTGMVHAFAVTLLPIIQSHLEKARSLAAAKG